MTRPTLKRLALCAALLTPMNAALAEPVPSDPGWNNRLTLVMGEKTLDRADWQDHERQGAFGLMFDLQREAWPFSIALDVFVSGDDDSDAADRYEGYTSELHLGARKAWSPHAQPLHYYAGAGIAFSFADEQRLVSGVLRQDEDTGSGYWANLGLRYELDAHLSVGIDLRHSETAVDLFGDEREAGGTTLGLGLGYRF